MQEKLNKQLTIADKKLVNCLLTGERTWTTNYGQMKPLTLCHQLLGDVKYPTLKTQLMQIRKGCWILCIQQQKQQGHRSKSIHNQKDS
jgi:hypothetical protein